MPRNTVRAIAKTLGIDSKTNDNKRKIDGFKARRGTRLVA